MLPGEAKIGNDGLSVGWLGRLGDTRRGPYRRGRGPDQVGCDDGKPFAAAEWGSPIKPGATGTWHHTGGSDGGGLHRARQQPQQQRHRPPRPAYGRIRPFGDPAVGLPGHRVRPRRGHGGHSSFNPHGRRRSRWRRAAARGADAEVGTLSNLLVGITGVTFAIYLHSCCL